MPHPRPLRVGVVGTGAISAPHLRYLSASPRTELVAVADLSPAAASWTARRWGAAAARTSHADLLEQDRPDVVHVLTPPPTHARIVTDALAAGAHVVCEKPLAATVSELVPLQEAARAADRWLLEDQNYRFNDPVLQLQELVSSGRLGAVQEVEVRVALPLRGGGAFDDPHLRHPAHDLPAGPLHDLLPHLVYLGLLFVPDAADAERVTAHWSNHGGDDGLWRTDDLDALVLSGPVHLRLRLSTRTRPDAFALTVRGDRGEAATDLFQPHLHVRAPRPVGAQLTPVVDHVANGAALARAGVRNLKDKLLQHSAYHGLERLLERTYTALQEGGGPPVSPRDVLDTARLTDRLVAEGGLL